MLKAGQIIVMEGANWITQLQGDTSAKHVCMVAKDSSKIWTTGAQGFAFYGQVDAQSYLKGKSFLLAEVVGLTIKELDIIEATHQAMKGQFYGFWKYAQFEQKGFEYGRIPFLGKFPQPKAIIKNPICSQAVGCALWRAGIKVGGFLGKKDATALLPETFETEVDRGYLLKKVN